MDKDAIQWLEDAARACKKASECGCLVMIREDDYGFIVTNALDASTIKSLGEAWSEGYGHGSCQEEETE